MVASNTTRSTNIVDDPTMTTKCAEPLCRAKPEDHGVCNWHNIVWSERLTYGLERAVKITVEGTGVDVDWVGHEQGTPIPRPSYEFYSKKIRDENSYARTRLLVLVVVLTLVILLAFVITGDW